MVITADMDYGGNIYGDTIFVFKYIYIFIIYNYI